MSELPGDLQYTSDHEWLRREDDGSVTVGITDHAQQALGDLVYVELPEVDQEVDSGGDMAVVESVKAASQLRTSMHQLRERSSRSMKPCRTIPKSSIATHTAKAGSCA
jgi:glycine cleavage system H lipoate-binding protein